MAKKTPNYSGVVGNSGANAKQVAAAKRKAKQDVINTQWKTAQRKVGQNISGMASNLGNNLKNMAQKATKNLNSALQDLQARIQSASLNIVSQTKNVENELAKQFKEVSGKAGVVAAKMNNIGGQLGAGVDKITEVGAQVENAANRATAGRTGVSLPSINVTSALDGVKKVAAGAAANAIKNAAGKALSGVMSKIK
jgi:hypothetical protein